MSHNPQIHTVTEVDRQERFPSHALVEVKKFRWLPFGTQSAVLLDISERGFKIEFTGEATINPGDKFYLNIPLSPLGIQGPAKLYCQAECKWFDGDRFRFGGVFISLTATDISIISQIVETLKERSNNFL
ncbi:MAG: PilZ domain-containing protein [Bdellovibrionota bacterium]